MKTIKRALAVAIALLLVAAMSVSAFAATAPTPTVADVVISGATTGDKFDAYKIMTVTYNSDNTLTYAWTSEVAALISDGTTVEDYAEMTKDEQQDFIAVLIADLIDAGATAVKTDIVVDAQGKATFEDLAWGGYLAVPTLTTSVYEVMIGVVAPKVVNGNWVVAQDEELNVKKTDGPTINKTANETNVGSWTTITYTVVFDVPTYDESVADDTLIFTDAADSDLVYVGDLAVAGLVGANDTDLDIDAITENYTLPSADDEGYTMEIAFDYAKVASFDQIQITYTAKIADDAALNAAITNNVTLEYSFYPYIEGKTQTVEDDEDVFTYGLNLFKYDASSTAETTYDAITADADVVALENAIFNLYRVDANGTTVDGISEKVALVCELTTNANGYATVDQISAGKYYLVEAQAPNGFNKLSSPVEFTFTDSDVDAQGRYGVAVGNNSGFHLPQTGDIGAIVLTVAGIALMAGAIVLLVMINKKKASANN